MRGGNEQSEHGKSGEGSSREKAGKGAEYGHPSKTGHGKVESRDDYLDLKSPGSNSHMEMPDTQEMPSSQQLPETQEQSD